MSIDIAIELAPTEKFELQSIHFAPRNTTDACIILIIKIDIIAILGGKEDTGDEKTMNSSSVDEQRTLISDNSVKVNKGDDEALHSAWSIGDNPFGILADGNTRGPGGMEASALGRRVPTVMTNEFLKGVGKRSNKDFDCGIRKSLHLHLGLDLYEQKYKNTDMKEWVERTNEQLGSATAPA